MVTAKKPSTATAVVTPTPKAPAKKAAAVKVPTPVAAAAAPKAAVKKSPAKKAAPVSATPVTARPAVTVEQRHNYIEVAAFYVAQRRGFAPGNPVDDWAMAEQEVDRLIDSGHFSR
ncbi:MAG: DUF2934 domain-containing protein [Rhodoferax sp.]|nr:DUF2934 domain-containing protein [Rhodoferax sp.]